MNSQEALRRLEAEARYFADFTTAQRANDLDVESLIDRYLDWRQLSADALRQITDAYLERDEWALDAVLERLENELRARLADVFPLEVVTIRRYGATHRKLFEYLTLHRGRPVPAARLRALTGDQIHTERRVRELRDIGLRIDAARRSGDNVYELTSEDPDVDAAMARLAPEFAKRVANWSAARRAEALQQLGLS
jgi:hypothetical protein